MAELPKIVRQRLRAGGGEVHPDADLLTAFAEKALGERERAQVLEHLAACAACREVVALALPQEEGEQARAAPQGMRGWVLRWQTAAALATVAVAAIALLTIPDAYFRARAPVQVAKAPPGQSAAAREENSAAANQPAHSEADAARKQAEASTTVTRNKKEAVVQGAGEGGAVSAVLADAERGRRDESKDKLGRVLPAPPAKEGQVSTFTAEGAKQVPPPAPPATYDLKTAQAAPAAPTYQAKAQSAGMEKKQAVGGLVAGAAQQQSESGAGKGTATAAPVAADQAQVAGPAQAGPAQAPARAANETVQVMAETVAVAPIWRTTAAGGLERSHDAGRNWHAVPVSAGAAWNAVSSVGEHVWAGGHRQRTAVLYHSGDGGAHWTRLEFTGPAGAAPAADVVALNFTDAQHGVMTVVAAEDPRLRQIWTTADGGHTWTAPPVH
ncbi:MAG TPA: zf-HC2 domain-containing protein [Terriglobales bacterium]|nr:zf-HC2 domain-containing protein [Terriglobales bacterium]